MVLPSAEAADEKAVDGQTGTATKESLDYVIILGGGVMQQAHLFPKIRAKVLDLLGGYVSSPSITPEGIDSYIVPPALGVNSGVIGALLLGARALEREGER